MDNNSLQYSLNELEMKQLLPKLKFLKKQADNFNNWFDYYYTYSSASDAYDLVVTINPAGISELIDGMDVGILATITKINSTNDEQIQLGNSRYMIKFLNYLEHDYQDSIEIAKNIREMNGENAELKDIPCAICGKRSRVRSVMYIVQDMTNTSLDGYIYVGSSCVKRMMGDKQIDILYKIIESLNFVKDMLKHKPHKEPLMIDVDELFTKVYNKVSNKMLDQIELKLTSLKNHVRVIDYPKKTYILNARKTIEEGIKEYPGKLSDDKKYQKILDRANQAIKEMHAIKDLFMSTTKNKYGDDFFKNKDDLTIDIVKNKIIRSKTSSNTEIYNARNVLMADREKQDIGLNKEGQIKKNFKIAIKHYFDERLANIEKARKDSDEKINYNAPYAIAKTALDDFNEAISKEKINVEKAEKAKTKVEKLEKAKADKQKARQKRIDEVKEAKASGDLFFDIDKPEKVDERVVTEFNKYVKNKKFRDTKAFEESFIREFDGNIRTKFYKKKNDKGLFDFVSVGQADDGVTLDEYYGMKYMNRVINALKNKEFQLAVVNDATNNLAYIEKKNGRSYGPRLISSIVAQKVVVLAERVK